MIVRRGVLVIGLLGALPPMLSGCAQTQAIRYRLELTFEAYGETKRTSVVQEFAYRRSSSELASPGKTSVRTRGDGAVLDLGRHGVVVSTLVEIQAAGGRAMTTPVWGDRPPLDRNWNAPALLAAALHGDETAWDRLEARADSRAVELDPVALPLLLHFRNRNTPLSVRKVDVVPPDADVKVRQAVLRLTADPLTRGVVDAALPWLPPLRERDLNLAGRSGSDGGPGVPFEIQATDITRE